MTRITDYESFRAAVEEKLNNVLDVYGENYAGDFFNGATWAVQELKSRIEAWDAYDEQY